MTSQTTTTADLAYFLTHPLTSALLRDNSYTEVPGGSALHYDPFFRRAARTHAAVLKSTFIFRAIPNPEGHLLLQVGHGVCGQSGVAHGGFLATVMDEVSGNLISATQLDEGLGMYTAALNMGYKRPVLVEEFDLVTGEGTGDGTGNVVMATARLGRVEGRKVFILAEIRNEKGEVCTTAELIFVKKKPAL
ncbi:HotDog domain-containing protein [Aspergillus granulosus]|uniref:HotDog domain-containing protein n=1 Tax=Aspergillus granulosus TaxID=176169 RepID=A0ABR4HR16_9EURO